MLVAKVASWGMGEDQSWPTSLSSMAPPPVTECPVDAVVKHLPAVRATLGTQLWLALAWEAVEMRRRLAAVNPAAYEPDLASSLNNLAASLA